MDGSDEEDMIGDVAAEVMVGKKNGKVVKVGDVDEMLVDLGEVCGVIVGSVDACDSVKIDRYGSCDVVIDTGGVTEEEEEEGSHTEAVLDVCGSCEVKDGVTEEVLEGDTIGVKLDWLIEEFEVDALNVVVVVVVVDALSTDDDDKRERVNGEGRARGTTLNTGLFTSLCSV